MKIFSGLFCKFQKQEFPVKMRKIPHKTWKTRWKTGQKRWKTFICLCKPSEQPGFRPLRLHEKRFMQPQPFAASAPVYTPNRRSP